MQIREESRFEQLSRQWRAATGHLSSADAMAMHPAYKEIVGMGVNVVPLILADLEREPDHWFYALRMITGASPVPAEDRGDMQKMAAAWVKWGRKNGHF